MSVIEDFWKEYEEKVFTFVDLELDKVNLTLPAARSYLIELAEKEPNDNQLFLSRTIEGKIDEVFTKFSDSYFPPFMCCNFKAHFKFSNGNEFYSLHCIFENNIYGKESDNLEKTYEEFINEAKRGSGIIKC